MDTQPLISDEYAEQNRLLHVERMGYGANGGRYAEQVYGLLATWHPRTVLDYGCGKGGLKETVKAMIASRVERRPKISVAKGGRHITFAATMPEWFSYDPGIPDKKVLPGVCDMVVCTDVLEHVEPEYIDRTMERLKLLTGNLALLTFALRASNKTLPDGRNTHLIVEGKEWWASKISEHFSFWSEIPWRNRETFMVVAFR